MTFPQKSTTVRFRNLAMRTFFRYAEHLAPGYAGRVANDLWFTAPARMAALPVPAGGRSFSVLSQGATVVGQVWGEAPVGTAHPPTVYLVHGWGGRGAQFGAMVEPLLQAGRRVVMFDGPSHGDSDRGPSGRRTSGVELAQALDAVFCRFGPAEAVVAHSMGTISTYLALRFGWLGADRLVLVAPMVEADSLFEQFQAMLGFGRRTRHWFDREVLAWLGVPLAEFDARVQARLVDARPTLVITDRGDRQTPYDDVVDFAATIDVPLITTEGLGHRKILRDPETVRTIVEFVTGARDRAQRSGTGLTEVASSSA